MLTYATCSSFSITFCLFQCSRYSALVGLYEAKNLKRIVNEYTALCRQVTLNTHSDLVQNQNTNKKKLPLPFPHTRIRLPLMNCFLLTLYYII